MTTENEASPILLVEDDEIQAVFVQAVLAREYNVTSVHTLAEALEHLSYTSFSAILLDLGLPDSDGAGTLTSISAAAPSTPIVVLTANDDGADCEMFQLGAQDFIRKSDFNLQMLRRSLRYAMERKRMEERLLAGRKLEVVGELAAGVAHEFNNLLQAIRGYAKMALDEVDPKSQANKDIKHVINAADDAANIAKQLLSFGRRVALRRETIDVNEMLTDQAQLLEPLIGEGINVTTTIAAEPAFAHVDPTELRQVIMNLCINARDAMEGNGQLNIESTVVALDGFTAELSAGDYVHIRIQDSGCGMTPEILARIYEPFFTTKEVGRGTGMGMSMVYGVLRQHGGGIDVASSVGDGTTFDIYLPVTSRRTEPKKAVSDCETQGVEEETVLIVEDDPSVRELCNRVLTTAGYRTMLAKDGVEAIHLFESHRDELDLVFLDLVIPRMTGRDVYELISAERADLPFLFCTGYAPNGAHATFIDEANGCILIEKPFSRESLLMEVRKMLDRRSACC